MSLVKNSALYLLSNIVIKAASFFLLPLYTHLVSPEDYGFVYVVSSFTNFMSIFLLFSLQSVISRFYFECHTEQEIKTFYSNITTMVFLGSSLIILLLFCFSNSLATLLALPVKYLYIALLISYFSIFYNLILSLLYVKQDAKKVSYTSIALGIIGILVQLFMVLYMEDKTMALTGSMLINAVLSFVIFVVYSVPYFTRPRFIKSDLHLYIKYAFSQWPSDVCVWLIHASDRLLINKFQGAHDTGIYGMGSNFSQIPTMLFHSVNKAYSPYVFDTFKKHEEEHNYPYKEIQKSSYIVISCVALLVTMLSLFSGEIVSLLSSRFEEASLIIPLVLIASFVDCVRMIFMYPMAYKIEYVKIKTIIWILSAIINLALNLWLIPIYSMYGACIASIVSFTLSCIVLMFFSNKAIKIPYNYSKLVLIVILSIAVGALCVIGISWLGFIIKVIVGCLYTYVLLKVNEIEFKKYYGKIFHNK